MSEECLTCQPIVDCPLDPFGLYTLNTEVFPPPWNCPPGYPDCPTPGTTISTTCCNQTFSASIPVGATNAQIEDIIADLQKQCDAANVACPDPCPEPPCPPPDPPDPPRPVCFNTRQAVYGCCANGTTYGFVTQAGRFFSDTCDQANVIARAYANQQATIWWICLGDLTATCTTDDSISFDISAWGTGVSSHPVNAWSLAAGTLPPGLVLQTGYHGPTITLSGTPTTPGIYDFILNLTSAAGSYAERTYKIEVLAAAGVNAAYNVTLAPPSCGAAKINKTLDGNLPPGLNWTEDINGHDIISGTPTTIGTCAWTLTYT